MSASQWSCCPLGLTGWGPDGETCGCRDDVAGTPYRIGYVEGVANASATTYTFNLASVDTSLMQVCVCR